LVEILGLKLSLIFRAYYFYYCFRSNVGLRYVKTC